MKTCFFCALSALLLICPAPARAAPPPDEPIPYPVGLVCIPSTAVLDYVEQPTVQDDLKLTAGQREKLQRLRIHLAEAEALAWTGTPFEVEKAIGLSDDANRLLGGILAPEQAARHSQIVLQHLIGKFGLAQIIGLLDVVVVLDLDAAQSQQVQTILEPIGYGPTDRSVAGAAGRRRRIVFFGAGGPAGGALPPGAPAPRGFRNPQAVQPPAGEAPVPPGNPNALAGRRARAGAEAAPGEAARVAERRAAAQARSRERLFAEFANPDLGTNTSLPMWQAYAAANIEISALLKPEQKQRLLAALGTPLAVWPAGSPPAVIRPGTNLLAFPRFGRRASWQRSFEIGTMEIDDYPLLATLLSSDEVRKELRLTDEQQQRFPPATDNPEDGPILIRLALQLLSQEQRQRFQQLVLQSARRLASPSVVFEFREVADMLGLSEAQRVALAKLYQAERRSIWHSLLPAVEANAELRPALDQTSSHRLAEILTAAQKEQLERLVGDPLEGPLPADAQGLGREIRTSLRSRVAPSVGYLTMLPENYLESGAVHRELQLSYSQLTGKSRPPGNTRRATPRRTLFTYPATLADPAVDSAGGLLHSLTPAQDKRYFRIVLQASVRSDGPAAVFRYRRTVEALSLTPEQEQKLLQVLWHDTRRYLATSRAELAERLPELDRQTTTEFTQILDADQRQRLTNLLDDTAAGVDAGADSAVPAPPQRAIDAGRTAPMRRLNYAVRHGSAVELAEIVRERYEDGDGASVVAAPGGNRLLIAAPEAAYDEIVAFVEELDRPRRTFVVDVMLVEGSALAPGDGQGIDDSQFTGTVDAVTNRLNALVREKKITGLRQIRIEVGQDRTGSVHVGRELMTISPDVTNAFRQQGAQFGFRARFAETRAAIISHPAGPDHVTIDLTLDDTRIVVPDAADELGIGPGGPVTPHETLNSKLICRLNVPLGEAVPARGLVTGGKSDASGLRVIVAARLAESASP
jgi:hypothetical protein